MNKLFNLLLIVTTLCCFVNKSYSQSVIEDLAEQFMSIGEQNTELYLEELSDYVSNPLNINEATKEDLNIFPFLSDKLVENILYYLYKYGPMLTDKELMMVEGMDRSTSQLLKTFVVVKPPQQKVNKLKIKNILKTNF